MCGAGGDTLPVLCGGVGSVYLYTSSQLVLWDFYYLVLFFTIIRLLSVQNYAL